MKEEKKIPKKKGRPRQALQPTVSINIRLEEGLIEELEKIAIKESRSRTKQVEIIVKEFIEKYKNE
jgi:metal-responsive CopG/Arc/MetJ family transcriptional regulator